MKLVEYAPYVLGFLILISLTILVAGLAMAADAGVQVPENYVAKHLAIIKHEDITVEVTTQNDVIGTNELASTKTVKLMK